MSLSFASRFSSTPPTEQYTPERPADVEQGGPDVGHHLRYWAPPEAGEFGKAELVIRDYKSGEDDPNVDLKLELRLAADMCQNEQIATVYAAGGLFVARAYRRWRGHLTTLIEASFLSAPDTDRQLSALGGLVVSRDIYPTGQFPDRVFFGNIRDKRSATIAGGDIHEGHDLIHHLLGGWIWAPPEAIDAITEDVTTKMDEGFDLSELMKAYDGTFSSEGLGARVLVALEAENHKGTTEQTIAWREAADCLNKRVCAKNPVTPEMVSDHVHRVILAARKRTA